MINGNSARFIQNVIQTELMEGYYKQKLGEVYNKVQWEVFQKALKQKKAKGALLKMFHGKCSTKKNLTMIRITTYPECPCCKQDIEDQHHLLKRKERSHETYIAFNEEMKKTFF
jgi:zinc-binding in reverse transcriptase